ncbi:MAG: septum formation protein Maf [Clostridia bacterium]|nr:septum formation protein Maf [Clostridia bacterium]
MEKIILASASPRRRELLEAAGIPHTVFRMDIDETPDVSRYSGASGLPFPEWYTRECALVKLRAAADLIYKEERRPVIVAADTVVSPDGERIFGKPADAADAARMLRELSGTDHTVVGGICVTDGERTLVSSVTTHVRFKELTEREIASYVESGEPFGKAGAYAIQGKASLFVESVSGDYANIVGISVFELRRMLAGLGHDPI